MRFLVSLLAIALLTSICPAAATLTVDAGWEGAVRPGTTIPIFITVNDDQPRAAMLEVIAPLGQDRLLRLYREIALGPTKATYPFLLPLDAAMGETVITLRDRSSGQLLVRRFAFERSPEMLPPDPSTQIIDLDEIFIGVSGDERNSIRLTEQLRALGYKAGHLLQSWLPDRAAGYNSVSVLVLDEPNLSRMRDVQREAILQWVSLGGLLILAPSSDPVPLDGLSSAFPAQVGENIGRNNAAASPSTLRARILTPSTDARSIEVASEISPAYERNHAKGRITIVSAPLVSLSGNVENARQSWQSLLLHAIAVPATQPVMIEEFVAAVPGLTVESFVQPGEPSKRPLMMLALAVAFFIGPVDWIILRRFGHRGWTLTTVTGFLGLVLTAIMLLAA